MFVGVLVVLGFFVADGRAEDAKTCFPECSPGYVCNPNTGTCVEACNPPCATGTRCTAERVCVSTAATPAAAPVSAAPTGTGKVCLKRKFSTIQGNIKWTIDLDGETVGTVGAGSEQCFASPAGPHKLSLTFNNVTTGAKVEATKTIQVAATQTLSVEAKLSGMNAANIVFE